MATVKVANWRTRSELRRRACAVLGRTEEQRQLEVEATLGVFQRRWLDSQDPAFLLPEYDSDWYALYTVECFLDYTAANITRFARWWTEGDRTGTVLDLGAGIGASSRLFAELTGADVVFHAYGESAQLRVARDLLDSQHVVVNPDEGAVLEATRPYAVMAFELFEHVRDPVRLARQITAAGVKVLCCANAFGALDFGHWPTYLVDEEVVSRDRIALRFGRELRALGWRKEETGFWNARPTIWVAQAAGSGSGA